MGTGTMTRSGNNTYSKNTNVSNGSLLMGGNNVLPDTAGLNLSSGTTFKTGGYSETTGKLTM
jgi:autotransporter-associated beta strand protein